MHCTMIIAAHQKTPYLLKLKHKVIKFTQIESYQITFLQEFSLLWYNEPVDHFQILLLTFWVIYKIAR